MCVRLLMVAWKVLGLRRVPTVLYTKGFLFDDVNPSPCVPLSGSNGLSNISILNPSTARRAVNDETKGLPGYKEQRFEAYQSIKVCPRPSALGK